MGNKKMIFFILSFALIAIIAMVTLFFKFKEERREFVFVYGFNETAKKQTNVSYQPTKILRNCTKDSDCIWMSTNCCPENAGANWECVNKNSYIDCKSKMILCPQVVSPKPKNPCRCVKGVCSGA